MWWWYLFLWQCWCVEVFKEGIGVGFLGIFNVLFVMDIDFEVLGINVYELFMVVVVFLQIDVEFIYVFYKVLEDWCQFYGGNLLIVLLDVFGIVLFLCNVLDWVVDWIGFCLDSVLLIEGGEKIIEWWEKKGCDLCGKLFVFLDGFDVEMIIKIYCYFEGCVCMSFGWGMNFINDFVDCVLCDMFGLLLILVVCKVLYVNGWLVVKFLDNLCKVMGEFVEVECYKCFFGIEDFVEFEFKV